MYNLKFQPQKSNSFFYLVMKNNPNYFYNPERIKVENPFNEMST